MFQLALFASFEYLCYGSTVTINYFLLSPCGDLLETSESDFYRLETSKFDPRTVKVKKNLVVPTLKQH